MDFESLFDIPIDNLHTPCYLTDARLLQKNTALLKQIQQRTGCKILLAQKAFSMFSAYPLIRDDLSGTTASGLFEAKLGREHFGKEVHVFSPAYTQEDFTQLLELCDHIVFNSFGQWKKYRQQVQDATRNISCGIRINPGYAEVETDLYNPCISGSRMGVPLEQMEEDGFDRAALDGIHTPVGLSIHAETPEEIAVSIVAELIQTKNQTKKTSGYDPLLMEYLTGAKETDQPKILATIIARRGSAPRSIGTKMLVLGDGRIIGTIGGGCMESEVQHQCLRLLHEENEMTRIIRADMTVAQAEDEGMVCGGTIDVFLEKFQ